MTPQDAMKTNNAHLKRVERYVSLLSALFSKSDSRLASLAVQADYEPERDGQFFFEDYPDLMKEAKKIVNELALGVENVIGRGTSSEWAKANEKADGIVSGLLKTLGVKKEDLTDDAISKYFNNHEAACLAFEKRVQKGMNLSSRVWNLAEHRRLELQLGVSIARGNSSDEIALNIQKFLKEPDKLFRRVRDEFGTLRLSKNAKAYTPEPGAYRSSYKNALRLARTEINMAYRSAEQERYNDFDFVVGFEVKRSSNPYPCPMCDAIAGKYPKDFVYIGAHPNCRCFIVPILISEEEMDKRRAAILNGEDFDCSDSVNYVSDVPDSFKKWCYDNTERIVDAKERGTLPYLIKDNASYVENSLNSNLAETSYEKALRISGEKFSEITDDENMSMAKGQILSDDDSRQIYDHYVGTGESFGINEYLREGSSSNPSYDAVVHSLDKAIEDNKLESNFMLYRRVDDDFARKVLGIKDVRDVIDGSSEVPELVGMNISNKGFSSTSCTLYKTCFSSRPVILRIKAPKGTNCYVTKNFNEAEYILGREQNMVITECSVRKMPRGGYLDSPDEVRDYFVIDCVII